MTLLRYSAHHGAASSPAARATAGRTYVKTVGGAKKSWSNQNRSLTTTASTTATTTNGDSKTAVKSNYHWTRQEASSTVPPAPVIPFLKTQQVYNERRTTWRRPTTPAYHPHGSQTTDAVNATLRNREDATTDTLTGESLSSHKLSSSSSLQEDFHLTTAFQHEHAKDSASARSTVQASLVATDFPERATSPNSIAAEPLDLTGHEESSVSSSSSSSSSQPVLLKKRGAHKLIRQDRVESPLSQQVQYKNDDADKTQVQLESSTASLRKIGPNKLVHSRHAKAPPSSDAADSAMAAAKRKLMYSAQQRRMHSHANSMAPVAKRVKLSEAVADSSSSSSSSTTTGTAQGEKLMTDFAYRETSKVPARSGNLTLNSQGPSALNLRSGRRNMGLVRVSPDEAKTPICPTFLQGLACTNESCTKRHDVPKEAATPICSYFQRQGQCAKGADCPFRHIKVNPRAIVCPSFSLLGFCQNEDCLMKHVRTNNNHNHKSGYHHNKTIVLTPHVDSTAAGNKHIS